jgi:hypothetical protein
MKTIAEYVLHTCVDTPGWKLINEHSIENGHTDSMDIYAKDSFDSSWTDQFGIKCTSGYRLTKDKKNRVLITVRNSFEKAQKEIEQRNLTINND